jgi:glycine/serine hydroxymethyltransferase
MTTILTPAVQPKPYSINVVGHCSVAFAQAAVHIRQGYIFSPDHTPEIYVQNGQTNLLLVLGTPEQHAIAAAEATTAEALEFQRVAYQREVEAAARQLLEDQKREEKQRAFAAEITEQKKALRKLEAAAQAA